MPLDDNLLKQLMPIFRSEASEHLQAMNRILLALEKKISSEEQSSLLEEVFRNAHSLKGAAKGVGMKDIGEVSHKMESIFGAVNKGELELTPKHFDLLYSSLDLIETIMQCVMDGNKIPSIEELVNELEAVAKGKSPRKIKAKASTEVSAPLDSAAKEEKEPEPSSGESKEPEKPEEPAAESFVVSDSFSSPREAFKESHSRLFKAEDTIRVNTSKLDTLMARMGELLVTHLRSDQRLKEIKDIYQEIERWHKEWNKLKESYIQGGMEYDEQLLYNAMDKIQQKTNSLRMQTNSLIQNFSTDIRNITMAMDGLQEEIKKVRMLPATTIFDTFERMVRDLTREEHKLIKLHIQGAETELDKKVIEEIKDPVMHLLRNCVDHGIEKPQLRKKNGKHPEGTISLSITQRGSNILLEVADDGAGIDVEKIKQVAVKRNLISSKDIKSVSDKEAMNFIFRPGFSTSPIVTDISGRGVGLDVVREKVEQLHGLINFESSPGVGSRFTLTLPLTLSTSHVCLIKCEGETFAIPISSIDRILLVDYEDISSIESKMAIEADGHPISLVDTAQILELATERRKLTPGKKFWAVILGSAERRMAFLVDELIGESKVVVKSLGKQLARVRNTSGATISSMGKVIMMLNVGDMIRSACSQDVSSRFGKIAASVQEGIKNILVVDDSITTRILEKNILETAGYDVMLASDGQEAWEMLEESECNLVVSDICMPRMNGFEFTAKVKRSEKHRETPVILVTSLESREDKERGIEVGADAYIVKSSFDQANLLETIKRLI